MYSRFHNRDIRLPPNYGGSAFNTRRTPEVTPVEDLTKKRTVPQHQRQIPIKRTAEQEQPLTPPVDDAEIDELCVADECDSEEYTESDGKKEESVPACAQEERSLLSPLGQLGTEELLLIALALIIFQSEKEPQLALILLALLFIK